MPSEHRLHPLSFLFALGGQVRALVVPGLIVLIAGSRGGNWEVWMMLLIIPAAVVAVGRSLSLRYRYEEDELVVRTGFVFRNERHVPYARIQNLDAVRNVLHRLLGLVEVRIETGGGTEPEATLSVLPLAAYDEMHARVFAHRTTMVAAEAALSEGTAPAGRPLLEMSPRELMITGFIRNRGAVVVAALFGLLWELGLADRASRQLIAEQGGGRGVVRHVIRAAMQEGAWPIDRILLGLGALLVILALVRLVSVVWEVVRLYGYRLSLEGADLKSEYGLLTRVTANIPLRRIQTFTVNQGPLHRAFERASLTVETAGSRRGEGTSGREWLAPLVRREELAGLLGHVLPGFDVTGVEWHRVDPRAFRRKLRKSLAIATIASLPLIPVLRAWTLVPLAVFAAFAWLHARQYVRHLGWGIAGDVLVFRSGWWRRRLSAARFAKVQAVALVESPFDRRARMARLRVDTAGAAETSHRLDIPYLARHTADELFALVVGRVEETEFKW